MTNKTLEISAEEFKSHCLQLIEQVNNTRQDILIKNDGMLLAKLVPVDSEVPDLFGCLKGAITLQEDIINPIDECWDAEK